MTGQWHKMTWSIHKAGDVIKEHFGNFRKDNGALIVKVKNWEV
jgi:hypothetical protein